VTEQIPDLGERNVGGTARIAPAPAAIDREPARRPEPPQCTLGVAAVQRRNLADGPERRPTQAVCIRVRIECPQNAHVPDRQPPVPEHRDRHPRERLTRTQSPSTVAASPKSSVTGMFITRASWGSVSA